MYPYNINSKIIEISNSRPFNIVLITKSNIQHKRLLFRLTEEFGSLVKRCYIYERSVKSKKGFTNQKIKAPYFNRESYIRLFSMKKIYRYYLKIIKRANDSSISRLNDYIHMEMASFSEKNLGNRIKEIYPNDINREWFLKDIKLQDPTILISCGGPILPQKVILAIKGLAINQHAGFSPHYKGRYTTLIPLYKKDLNHVGNTIHITSPNVDEGDIIRRSTPAFCPDDDERSIGLRNSILGNELLMEALKELIETRRLRVFEQEKTGETILKNNYDIPRVSFEVNQAIRSNWLNNELDRISSFW